MLTYRCGKDEAGRAIAPIAPRLITGVRLTAVERNELVERARARSGRAEDARRARLILMLAADRSYTEVRRALGCNPSYISRWKRRFLAERLAGLYSRHSGRAVEKRTPLSIITRKSPLFIS